jgi:hypothetical protein
MQDWYSVGVKQVVAAGGAPILKYYGGSLQKGSFMMKEF